MPVRTQPARLVILMAVVLAHVGLVVLWPGARTTRAALSTTGHSSTLVFLTRSDSAPPDEAVHLREKEVVRPTEPAANPPDKAADVTEAASKSITQPTDWARAAQVAIDEQLKSDERARRKDEVFSRRDRGGAGQSDQSVPKPQFGWARWHTERVQTLEQGGILIHLNERCVLVISVLAMPMCGLGKIQARGDLFDHMNDPPEPGDWK